MRLSKLSLITLISLLSFTFLSIGTQAQLFEPTPASPDDFLYGAFPTSDFRYVGYMISERTDGAESACGMNFVSPTIGITAAHCVEDYVDVDANIDQYDYTKTKSESGFQASAVHVPGSYVGNTSAFDAGFSDIALIEYDSENIPLTTFPKIGTPLEVCNYYIVGYGKNEDNDAFDRRQIYVCIENIEKERFELTVGDSHFCQGDSGSGIYEKGTNKLVGLVSSFLSPDGDCANGSRFFATRVDTHIDFLEQYIDFDFEGPTDFTQPTPTTDNDPFGLDDDDFTQEEQAAIEQSAEYISYGIIACVCLCIVLFFVIGGFLLVKLLSKKNNTNPPSSPMTPAQPMPPTGSPNPPGGTVYQS